MLFHTAKSLKIRPLSVAIATILMPISLLSQAALANDSRAWECKAGADGQWECYKNGVLEDRPAAAPVVKALPTPTKPATLSIAEQPTAAPAYTPKATVGLSQAAPEVKVAEPTAEPKPVVIPKPVPSKPQAIAQPEPVVAQPAQKPMPAAETVTTDPIAKVVSAASNASRLDEKLNWGSCGVETNQLPTFVSFDGNNANAPMDIVADSAELSRETNENIFLGKVEHTQGSQQIFAEAMRYNQETGQMDAQGDVLMITPDMRMSAPRVSYNTKTRSGDATDVLYRMPGILGRGTSENTNIIDDLHSEHNTVTYTTCAPGDNAWSLHADKLIMDQEEGVAWATHATINVGDMPIAYLPAMSFPLDDRRRSGVLRPTFSNSKENGFDFTLPYYLNLAPNYDLTLYPRYLTERGAMLGGEYRFLTEMANGTISADVISDDKYTGNSSRSSLKIDTSATFNDRLTGNFLFNEVSDNDYLDDFGGTLAVANTTQLERRAEMKYQADNWYSLVKFQDYQALNATEQYARLPQVLFHGDNDKLRGNSPLIMELDAEAVSFSKDDANAIEGERYDIKPRVALDLREPWYHLKPALSVRHTAYNTNTSNNITDGSVSRSTYTASIDSGLYFERNTSWFGEGALQTLEPRAYYLYTPHKDQRNINVFDTAAYGFDFAQLFRDNRFNGPDRVGDANQLTLALTSRTLSDQNGAEIFRASIGEVFYFEDRRVQIDNSAAATTNKSDLVGEIAWKPAQNWETKLNALFDTNTDDVKTATASANYYASNTELFNIKYIYNDASTTATDNNQQLDISGIWSVAPKTNVFARLNRSLKDDKDLDALAGFEYGSCCWRVRTFASRATGDESPTFTVEFELNGLGRIGDDTETLLNDRIYGYRREDD